MSLERVQPSKSSLFWATLLVVLLVFVWVAPDGAARHRKKSGKRTQETTSSSPLAEVIPARQVFLDFQMETRSLSVGRANGGSVRNAQSMPLKGPTWAFIPAVRERQTNWGKGALQSLLVAGSEAVAQQFPGSRMLLGNMGLEGGSKIRQSMSHQSGRDVDIAFYAINPKGKRDTLKHLTAFDEKGKAANGWTLDVERTWALVAFFAASEQPTVQWMFVSDPVRHLLLVHAREIHAPEKIVRRAEAILKQPSDSNPHADHFHLRIHCDTWDILAGCEEYGPERAYRHLDLALIHDTLEWWQSQARLGDDKEQLHAVDRIAAVSLPQASEALSGLLCQAPEEVVERAIDALFRKNPEQVISVILGKLRCGFEGATAHVLFRRLASLRLEEVWREAANTLEKGGCSKQSIETHEGREICLATVNSLGYSMKLRWGELLVPLLDSREGDISKTSLASLQRMFVTEKPPSETDKDPQRAWRHLVRATRKKTWQSVARERLEAAGVPMQQPELTPDMAQALLSLIRRDGVESYAAQVFLAEALHMDFPRILSPRESRKFWDGAVSRWKKERSARKSPERSSPRERPERELPAVTKEPVPVEESPRVQPEPPSVEPDPMPTRERRSPPPLPE